MMFDQSHLDNLLIFRSTVSGNNLVMDIKPITFLVLGIM